MSKVISNPFLKWAGGKTQLLHQIEEQLPKNIHAIPFTYIEAFVGSGAVLFWMLEKFPNMKNVIINDINLDLTNCYLSIKNDVENLINDYFFEPLKIEIAPHGTPLEQIKQSAYHVPNFNTKVNLLKHLLRLDESMTRVLIFIGTKKLADMLYERLLEDFEEDVSVIHSNKSQNFRMNSIQEFHNGGIKYLVATDIIARGVDISEVTHVINFDMPEAPESYIHRIGRTGRADRDGVSIAFITDLEQECQMRVETLMKKLIPLRDLPVDLEISNEKLPFEIPVKGGDKSYLLGTTLRDSQGAFHQKKLKNTKVNLAHEKRRQRKIDLGKLKRKPKK